MDNIEKFQSVINSLTPARKYTGGSSGRRLARGLASTVLISGVLALAASASADYVVGPGAGIGANAYDSGGTRTNISLISTVTLPTGSYRATQFSFVAGAIGDVVPFLAIFSSGTLGSSTEVFQVIAVGSDNNITSSAGYGSHTNVFGGSNTFSVPIGGETIYAGITGTTGNNPVPLLFIGADAHNPPAFPIADFVPGSNLPAFASYPDLAREYAFSVGVVSVPTPSAGILMLCGALGALCLAVRSARTRNRDR